MESTLIRAEGQMGPLTYKMALQFLTDVRMPAMRKLHSSIGLRHELQLRAEHVAEPAKGSGSSVLRPA